MFLAQILSQCWSDAVFKFSVGIVTALAQLPVLPFVVSVTGLKIWISCNCVSPVPLTSTMSLYQEVPKYRRAWASVEEVWTTACFLANTSVRSPQKLFSCLIKISFYTIKSSQKTVYLISNTKSLLLATMTPYQDHIWCGKAVWITSVVRVWVCRGHAQCFFFSRNIS